MTDFTFRNCKTPQGEHEASLVLDWYAGIGSYRIKIHGYGVSDEEAEKSARLLLGQAKAALTVASIHRVPPLVNGAQDDSHQH